MRRIIGVLAVVALVGCGGKGGDKDAFCAAAVDFLAAGDDAAARATALETMVEESPKKLDDPVGALRDLDPGSVGYEEASDALTSFRDENCDTSP